MQADLDLSNDNMVPLHEIYRRLGASSYKLNDLDKSKYFEKAYKEIKTMLRKLLEIPKWQEPIS